MLVKHKQAMNTHQKSLLVGAFPSAALTVPLQAPSSVFTYQGWLSEGPNPKCPKTSTTKSWKNCCRNKPGCRKDKTSNSLEFRPIKPLLRQIRLNQQATTRFRALEMEVLLHGANSRSRVKAAAKPSR
jgi:hypothetical protein